MIADVPVKIGRKGDPVGTTAATRVSGKNKVAHDSRDDAVNKSSGKNVRPLANRRTRAADTKTSVSSGATKQSESGYLLHGADDLTTARKAKQTAGQRAKKTSTPDASAGVHQRPLTSNGLRVIDRIDKAMKVARVSNPKLAEAIGVSPQSLTNLRRKPHGGMRAELLAHAAEFLRCDLHWLCTGEGGEYVPAQSAQLSRLAREVAQWLDEMSSDDRWKAYAMILQMHRGFWPSFIDDSPVRTET